MEFVSDLHLHSKYARAVSPEMNLLTIARVAIQKGIHLVAIPDWTHPVWMKEVERQIEEANDGVYRLRPTVYGNAVDSSQSNESFREPLFVFSTEIASIYKQGGRLRRIHNLVMAPGIETVKKINKALVDLGCNLSSDGRPIIGLSSKELGELVLSIDEKALVIPCHIWTPHFGIYGSASGFDTLEEAFSDMTDFIYGIETGLSSDPEMNWQVQELMTRSILSFSDAHSPAKMGREVTVFVNKNEITNDKLQMTNKEVNISYKDIRQAITRKGDTWRIGYTIEFYPEEGKYHFSGHRKCGVVRGPDEIRKNGALCPVCRRRLTEGVFYRVQQLSDEKLLDRTESKHSPSKLKWYTDRRRIHPPYVKLVPLLEIVAESLGSTVASHKVKNMYDQLTCHANEFTILLKMPIGELEKIGAPKIAEGIARIREGNLSIIPGYDGEYGRVAIWQEEKKSDKNSSEDNSQLGLL